MTDDIEPLYPWMNNPIVVAVAMAAFLIVAHTIGWFDYAVMGSIVVLFKEVVKDD